ncbi:MAG: twin-arginine translocase TatA/TatE family subunit [Thermoleophilia bacterium]
MFDFSPIQIMVVLAIALVIFGPKRLPELGKNLGRGIRDFKSGITGEDDNQPHQAAAVHSEPAPTPQGLLAEAATPETVKQELHAVSQQTTTNVG